MHSSLKIQIGALYFWWTSGDPCRVIMVNYQFPTQSLRSLPLLVRYPSQLGLLAVLVLLVAGHLFDYRLSPTLFPPDCYRHGKNKINGDELNARAKANGYQGRARREEDSHQDRNKHGDDTKKDQDEALDRYV